MTAQGARTPEPLGVERESKGSLGGVLRESEGDESSTEHRKLSARPRPEGTCA